MPVESSSAAAFRHPWPPPAVPAQYGIPPVRGPVRDDSCRSTLPKPCRLQPAATLRRTSVTAGLWRTPLSRSRDCESDGVRASPLRQLRLASVVPMHAHDSFELGALLLLVPSRHAAARNRAPASGGKGGVRRGGRRVGSGRVGSGEHAGWLAP